MASILGYTRVAILANTDAYGSGVASAFMEACKLENIDVPLYLSFEPVDSGAEQDLDSKLMQIKSAGLRVIMLAGQVGAPKPARPSAQNLPPERGCSGQRACCMSCGCSGARPCFGMPPRRRNAAPLPRPSTASWTESWGCGGLATQRNDAQELFRKAHALGLTGEDYLWLGVDAWMANPIYDNIEDPDERAMLEEATQGAVGLLPDIKGSIYDDYVSNVWQGASIPRPPPFLRCSAVSRCVVRKRDACIAMCRTHA